MAKPRHPQAVSASVVHYGSTGGLTELDPKKAGTGGASERRRFGGGNFGVSCGTAVCSTSTSPQKAVARYLERGSSRSLHPDDERIVTQGYSFDCASTAALTVSEMYELACI